MSRFRSPVLAALAVLSLAGGARAHPIPFSYLDVHLEPTGIAARLTVHIIDLAHDLDVFDSTDLLDRAYLQERAGAALTLVRERLRIEADRQRLVPQLVRIEPVPERQAVALELAFEGAREPGMLAVGGLLFPYDPQHQTFCNIYERDALARQEILNEGHVRFEHFTGTRQGRAAVIGKFLPAGMWHIFIGADHVLFLIGLLLAGGSLLQLLRIVTAFTLAHSVTLALAALDLVHPPARVIEPAIALSIVYVGLDNILTGKGRDMRAWIALAFGLIHGFGFANVLRELGLSRSHLGWSLAAFNLGVEVGQAAIVLAVAPWILRLARKDPASSRKLLWAGSLLVAAAGGYWFIQRVFFAG
jgi:hydrogenase/urease accessory protein HupE